MSSQVYLHERPPTPVTAFITGQVGMPEGHAAFETMRNHFKAFESLIKDQAQREFADGMDSAIASEKASFETKFNRDLDALTAEHDVRVSELQEQIAALTAEQKELNRTISTLTAELEALKQEHQELEAQGSSKHSRLAATQDRSPEATAKKISELEQSIAALQENLVELTASKELLSISKEQVEAHLSTASTQFKAEKAALQAELDALQSKLGATQAEFQRQVHDLKDEAESLTTEKNALTKTTGALQERLDAAESTQKDLQIQLEKANQALANATRSSVAKKIGLVALPALTALGAIAIKAYVGF